MLLTFRCQSSRGTTRSVCSVLPGAVYERLPPRLVVTLTKARLLFFSLWRNSEQFTSFEKQKGMVVCGIEASMQRFSIHKDKASKFFSVYGIMAITLGVSIHLPQRIVLTTCTLSIRAGVLLSTSQSQMYYAAFKPTPVN